MLRSGGHFSPISISRGHQGGVLPSSWHQSGIVIVLARQAWSVGLCQDRGAGFGAWFQIVLQQNPGFPSVHSCAHLAPLASPTERPGAQSSTSRSCAILGCHTVRDLRLPPTAGRRNPVGERGGDPVFAQIDEAPSGRRFVRELKYARPDAVQHRLGHFEAGWVQGKSGARALMSASFILQNR